MVNIFRMKIETLERRYNKSCKCSACVSMCLNGPCGGTIKDMQKLIDKGLTNKLTIMTYRGVLVPIPGTIYTKQTVSPYPEERCLFLKKGLCSIHDIKPLVGKVCLCNHVEPDYKTRSDVQLRVWDLITQEWGTDEGLKFIRKLRSMWKTDNTVILNESSEVYNAQEF